MRKLIEWRVEIRLSEAQRDPYWEENVRAEYAQVAEAVALARLRERGIARQRGWVIDVAPLVSVL